MNKLNQYFLFLIFLMNSLPTWSVGYGDAQVFEVTSIYDGDTFRVNIKEWPKIIGERIPVRVRGVDTPEIRSKCKDEVNLARAAKQFAVGVLRSAKTIELKNIE